jgi:hypothetical protein
MILQALTLYGCSFAKCSFRRASCLVESLFSAWIRIVHSNCPFELQQKDSQMETTSH